MSIRTDYQIKLDDGYSIGYAEYGDPQGKPILYFHGCPGSRLDNNRPAVPRGYTPESLLSTAPGLGFLISNHTQSSVCLTS
jgi:hypothetical protein